MVILIVILTSCSLTSPMVPITGAQPSATPVYSETNIPPLSDDVWDRIIANNKIVVGTAWDYPPFASVDSNFQVVGYDIALIREIGTRLNIPVDIQNFPFDGLQNALQINQIDLAVAAISITPERSSQMAFSPIYYVNQTAVLARVDSSIPNMTNVSQMAGYRVGVQRGTTYESWLQDSLMDTGVMQADHLFRYLKAEDAIRDLEVNRIDLVVMGQASANFYNTQNGLRVVAIGTDQQDLAVAMRLATPRLKSEIDRVMEDMLADGTMLRLIQEYVQNDASEALPTPYPPSQATPTSLPPVSTAVPAACVDGMKFVADITYPDNNMNDLSQLKPGESFVKVWRLLNNGNCTWTPNYHLVYAYGNVEAAQMNGLQVAIPRDVVPGEEVDVSVTLVAPIAPSSTYQGFWQMENSNGDRFGRTVWVGISTLSDQNFVTSCEVTFTGSKKLLNVGDHFDAVWTVKNTSGEDWKKDEVDYKYVGGTQMYEKNASYDLSETIKNGESGTIIVDMIAPDQAGTYSTQWDIVSGSNTLCNMMVTVTVK